MGDIGTIAVVAGAFLAAGFVKGVIGMGLPTVSLALLAIAIGLKEAMALMLIPSIVTNFWQALAGPHFRPLVNRLWPLLLTSCPAIWFGTGVLARGNALQLAAILGVMIILYSSLVLARVSMPAPGRHERWLSPLIGAVTGVITGLTGSFIMPAVLYMQSLKLTRDELVQAMGIAFSISMVTLALALAGRELMSMELGVMSSGALLPAVTGMMLGTWVRKRMSEEGFRRVFFIALLLVGAWLALRPVIL